MVVAAAADLQSVIPALNQTFGDPPIRFVIGASGILARQIENGAPYDAYLSANTAYIDALTASGRLERGSATVYAVGRLGLWSREGIRWVDLGSRPLRHLAMANPEHAPYGRAARQALERSGKWARLSGSVVYGENVRQAFQFAETGNADAVLTSWSLVKDRRGELVDATLHDPLLQSAAVVSSSPRREEARAFVRWLAGAEAQAILQRHGFSAPGGRLRQRAQ